MERAARDLGAGQFAVLRDIILPGMRPAFLSSFVYNFSSSMTTAGAIIFLIDASRKVAVFSLFEAVYSGEYALASLISTMIIVIVLAVEGLVYFFSNKEALWNVS
jgi:iron(III) transport system permease protein